MAFSLHFRTFRAHNVQGDADIDSALPPKADDEGGLDRVPSCTPSFPFTAGIYCFPVYKCRRQPVFFVKILQDFDCCEIAFLLNFFELAKL
jgi:hypothetical protein